MRINGPPRILSSDKRQSSYGNQELGSFLPGLPFWAQSGSHEVIFCTFTLPVFLPSFLICLIFKIIIIKGPKAGKYYHCNLPDLK